MAIVIIAVFSHSSARILNVPCDYATIQAGIDASYDGDTILVAPGIYVENLNFNGHNITLCSRFFIYNDTSAIYETIIDGDSLDSVIKFNHDESNEATITGFTIRNGAAYNGGGIYCIGADPAIKWNIITLYIVFLLILYRLLDSFIIF